MKHLAALHQFFWKYKTRLLLGVLFIILTNYFRILAPQLTGHVINTVVATISGKSAAGLETKNYDHLVQGIIRQLDTATPAKMVLYTGIILLALAILSGLCMFLMRQTIIVMSRLIEYDQKNQVFAHYLKLDTHFYKSHHTGDLMNRISEDVSRVRMYTGPAIMYFINLATVIGFSLYFMLKSDWLLTIYTLAPLPLLALTIYFVNTIINKKSEKIQSLLSDLTTNAQESYSGIRVIKSFVQEKAMLGFFKKNSDAYKENALSLAKTEAIYFPSMGLLIGLSTLITVLIGALHVVHGNGSPGKFAEFVLYIQMLTFPVSAIGWTASMTQRAAASQKRINEFLNTVPAGHKEPEPLSPAFSGSLQFSHVSFTYPDTGITALRDFSLQLKPGEKLAIVGKTGSGKSTIAQLLLKMYDPQEGVIICDGIPLQKWDTAALRRQISYVPQDVFLFSDSVLNNIAFGNEAVSEADVTRAAAQAAVHREIEQFDQQYATQIGERGVTLSGGQKQRISIARALVKDPALVIFDDCLSAVDARTEQEIISGLNSYLQHKSAIIITHRIFSLLRFDRIIVLQDGHIAEQGTHDELMETNGLYADLYRQQQAQNSSN